MPLIVPELPGIGSLDLPRLAQRDWRPGRSIFTDFSNAARDSARFDVANATYTTDSGDASRTVITPTTITTTTLSFLLKPQFTFRDFDIRLRYRNPASPHTSSDIRVPFRYLAGTDYYYGYKTFNAAHDVGIGRRFASTDASLGGGTFNSTTIDTDITATTPRFLRVQVTGNVFRIKSWLASADEPTWQIVGEHAPGGSVVFLEEGIAGFTALVYNTDWYFSELVITELLPTTDNLLSNADFKPQVVAGTTPYWWQVLNGSTVVNAADPWGTTRPVLQMSRPTTGDPATVQWQQWLYSSQHTSAGSARSNRFPVQVAEFPPALELSCWTKGVDLVHTVPGSDFLGAGWTVYQYAEDGTGLMIGQPYYYGGLGPWGIVGASDATSPPTGGAGTQGSPISWGWYLNRFRVTMYSPERCVAIKLGMGLHDSDVTGTILICDPVLRPVA
jgi:hypothetical protein